MTLYDTDIELLRSTADNAMVNSCTILTPTASGISDGAGYLTFSGTSITSPCRLVEQSGNEAISAEQIRQFGAFLLWLPVNLNSIDPRAVITVNGQKYRVVWTPLRTYDDAYIKLGLEILV
jgi:hypothetical protein